ncbi:NETI motif-containing protein [Bacillus litorisediminis]|uniref:NETI motif-containing protein n=1 Tax=Bacillus litorisediminis TaxID=2922713 RepID=UPI001FAB38F8|nr:NETI motif-containing protein [Bacillus litorisediminis]
MSKSKKKKWFTVLENETVDDCLKRMAAEGYVPIRRMEKPIFEEIFENGNKVVKPVNQEIQFQGELADQ